MSELRSAIVLSVDRLRAEFVGFSGNTWIATPAMNRLAVESLVFDEAHAAGLGLANFFREAWTDHTLLTRARSLGLRTLLITDDADAADAGNEAGFQDVVELPVGHAIRAVDELEDTHLAGVLATALTHLDRISARPSLAWLHLGSLGQTWDAPQEFRERYHEEEDAEPPTFVAPPALMLPADFDPDERWGYALAYAAQVSALDACLDLFLEHLRGQGTLDNALFTLFGVRGYPLGEHRRVGPVDGSLLAESLHVSWLVRRPDAREAMSRRRELVSPRDVAALVEHWFAESETPFVPAARESLAFHSENERAVRTPDWFLRSVTTANGVRHALYAKPDDRWEINDVHDRCHEVLEELLQTNAPPLPDGGRVTHNS